jgi:hypothetical protein
LSDQRTCPACGKILSRKKNEAASAFARRKSCDRKCAQEARGAEWTEITPYKSQYGARWLSECQWLAEAMCARMQKKADPTVRLPLKFWASEVWAGVFKLQTIHAGRLLKKFSAAAIGEALRSPAGQRITSLGAPWLVPLVINAQAALAARAARVEAAPPAPPELDLPVGPRPVLVKEGNILSKLKGL